MRVPCILALAASVSFTPSLALAQIRLAPRPDLSDPATRACVAALPAQDFTPALVSLAARSALPRDSGAVNALFLLAQDVATRLREQIGAPSGVVPNVDSTLPWTAMWGWLDGELHLDGTVTMTPQILRSAADSLAREGDALIERALQSLLSEGETWPFEPLEFILSVPFTLFFAAPDVTANNTSLKTWRTIGIPVFVRSLPKYAPIRWSRESTQATMIGDWTRVGTSPDSVTFIFRYDEAGKVESRSVREVSFLSDVPSLNFEMSIRAGWEPRSDRARAREHAMFVRSMARRLDFTDWSIGRIGSCPLPRSGYQSFRLTFRGQP